MQKVIILSGAEHEELLNIIYDVSHKLRAMEQGSNAYSAVRTRLRQAANMLEQEGLRPQINTDDT